LQQHFNQFVFKHEQILYEREGVEWSFIQFPDNADILELLENRRTGIFALCDEQVRFPKATDLTLVSKIYEHCSTHPRFSAGPTERANHVFVVKHFAGPVAYSSHCFLEKNHDVVRSDMADILKTSSCSFINGLFSFLRVDDNGPAPAASGSAKPGERRGSAAGGARRASMSGKISTLSGEFRVQLEDLMQKINGTAPHYVRCLKPNTSNVGDVFEPQLVIGQLRCGGVLEAVRVSRAGYPNRYSFDHFVNRYEQLGHAAGVYPRRDAAAASNNKKTSSNPKKPQNSAVKDAANLLCDALADMCWASSTFIPCADAAHLTDKMQRAGLQKGNTMIFLRSRTFEFLERELQLLRKRATIKIQSIFRSYSCMTSYRILKRATVDVQCIVRMWLAVSRVQKLREARAVFLLLRCTRGFLARQFCRRQILGVSRLQALKRGQDARVRVIDIRRVYLAARKIQCRMRIKRAKRDVKQRRVEARSLKSVSEI
jgi:myosin-5